MQDFRGKVALITGAASGIGAGLALALAREGADLALCDISDAEATANRARELGVRATSARVDVTDRAAVEGFASAVYAEFGRVDLLCNNAGVVVFGPLLEVTDRDWDWVLGVNLRGLINVAGAFVPRMLEQQGDRHVLVTASGAGLLAGGALPLGAYTTSKFAAVGYAESLRHELAPFGIGVTILCPGSVKTGILDTAHYSDSSAQFRPPEPGAPTPTREGVRRMEPSDVAELALRGIRNGSPYVLTHPEAGPALEERCRMLAGAVDEAKAALGM